ncbi:MAG: hypothetical protein ACR2NU_06300, partial [Aeoliella sp.]
MHPFAERKATTCQPREPFLPPDVIYPFVSLRISDAMFPDQSPWLFATGAALGSLLAAFWSHLR